MTAAKANPAHQTTKAIIAKERSDSAQMKWNAVLEHLRKGCSAIEIKRLTGVDTKTQRVWWEQGNKRFRWGHRPMRDLVSDEVVEARARLSDRAQRAADARKRGQGAAPAVEDGDAAASKTRGPGVDEVEKARRHAIEARAQEGQAVALSRGNALGLLSMALNLQMAMGPLSKKVSELMQTQVVTVEVGLQRIRQVTQITTQAVQVAHQAIEMDRLLLGDPNAIAGTASSIADTMTNEEAIAELERAGATIRRMKDGGVLHSLRGGKDASTDRVAPEPSQPREPQPEPQGSPEPEPS